MELWLNYKNDEGDVRRISVNQEKFTVGRHSENDLCIPKNQLSRRHAEIDRYEDDFILTDLDSSNGTKLNGQNLYRPTGLKNGDRINFGDGAEIQVEITSASSKSRKNADVPPLPKEETSDLETDKAAEQAEAEAIKESEILSEVKASDMAPAIVGSAAPKKSGMGVFFFIAPLMVFVVLLFGGLILWLAGGGKDDDISKNSRKNNPYYPDGDDDKPNKNKKSEDPDKSPTPSPTKSGGNSSSNGNSSSSPEGTTTPTGTPVPVSSEKDAIERNALSFLRKIPNGNSNPVLDDKKISEINQAIKSVKGSSSLKDGLQSAKKNASQIEALAKSKNLRPQFLAAAALAKGGDPLATAQGMSGDLNSLVTPIGNENADEILMVVAAYQSGGAQSKLPSMLGNLADKSSANARQVRTIWFLHANGKITDEQYQFALKFLAIGTIMQNPKDFNVQAEAVVFN